MVDFLIIGAQKAGTTAAKYNLGLHPNIFMFDGVTKFEQREIQFFNQHWNEGKEWYYSHFNKNKNILNGEKTAELFHRSICHHRIKKTSPNVKLILLLRCPIERAHSQWKMAYFNKKDEIRSFNDTVKQELMLMDETYDIDNFYKKYKLGISNWRQGYLLKGNYMLQIKSLLNYFSRDNIHICISERVRLNKEIEYNKIFNFLNISNLKFNPKEFFVSNYDQPIDKKTKDILIDFYRKSNSELFNFIDEEIYEWL
jgi:hypothetical protein